MKPVKVLSGAYSTKRCTRCKTERVTHRLTQDTTCAGYCYKCAKIVSDEVNKIEHDGYETDGERYAKYLYGL